MIHHPGVGDSLQRPNRLAQSPSLYLRQHGHNPVDWFEWGDEAFEEARRRDCPIIISSGYSSCHWCHVMERECFEKEAVARVMNEYFVCIKVDREERPDIDAVLMDYVHMMGLRGGWPLTIFMTPEGAPFYGGTYFPPQVWVTLLHRIAQVWEEDRTPLIETGRQLIDHYRRQQPGQIATQAPVSSPMINTDRNDPQAKVWLEAQDRQLKRFDVTWGGFGNAPKFPMPTILDYLLIIPEGQQTMEPGKITPRGAALKTLLSMAHGGIYDHIGGGFARYSTDRYWRVPHFEKMLYDNGQLLATYARAYRTGLAGYAAHILEGTTRYLLEHLTGPDGQFFSAQDADSEGEEGTFYIWTPEQLEEAAGQTGMQTLAATFQIDPEGNWEERPGHIVMALQDHYLHADDPLPYRADPAWPQVREKLTQYRSARQLPVIDSKVVLCWHALTLSGLLATVRAGLGEHLWPAIDKGFAYVERTLMTDDGSGYHTDARQSEALLDDMAALALAYLDRFTLRQDSSDLEKAKQCLATLERFSRPSTPFLAMASTPDPLIGVDKFELHDNVVPSGNSLAALAFARVGWIELDDSFLSRAADLLSAFEQLGAIEVHYAGLWGQVRQVLTNPIQIVVSGDHARAQVAEIARQAPDPLILVIHDPTAERQPGLAADKKPPADGEGVYFYLCEGRSCQPPVHTLEDLSDLLTSRKAELNSA